MHDKIAFLGGESNYGKCEEFAIFTTKRELEHFVDAAPLADTDNFNRNDYLGIDEEPATDDSFQPMNFDNALTNP